MKKHNLFKGLFTCLLALVLVAGTFAASAKAAAPSEVTATYNAASDDISVVDNAVIYVLKSKDGVTVKASEVPVSIASGKNVKLSDLGIKGTTNDVYLYVCNAAFSENTENVKPNLTIMAQEAKKVVGTIDYTMADGDAGGAVTAIATDKDKKAIENVTIYWAEEKDGTFAPSSSFTGAMLAKKIEDGATIYIKMLGKDGTGNDTAVRTSQAYKVKIAKQAKAPKLKLDIKKGTISIKNGFDFALAGKDGSKFTLSSPVWHTVLPYLKGVKNAEAIVGIAQYKPADKKDNDAKNAEKENDSDTTTTLSFTKTQIKALAISEIESEMSAELNTASKDITTGFQLAVRVSATDKKPASAIAYCDIAKQENHPLINTLENVKGYTTIAESDTFSFKAPEVVNYVDLWTGIGSSAKPSGSATNVDKVAPKYEMAVVNATDLNGNIDMSSIAWKSFKVGAKVTDKLKTKYTVDGKVITATLKAGASTADADSDVYLLIRRAGVKGKTIDDSVIASEYLMTRVYKADNYVWTIVYSEDALIGEEAWKAIVHIYKYKSYTSGAVVYDEDTDATIVKYQKVSASDDLEVALPSISDGVYVDAENAAGAVAGTAVSPTKIASGKITVEKKTANFDANAGAGVSEAYVFVKEYANITVDGKKIDTKANNIFVGSTYEISKNIAGDADNEITGVKVSVDGGAETAIDEVSEKYSKAIESNKAYVFTTKKEAK